MKRKSVNILTALAICAGVSGTAITADAQTTPRSNSSAAMSDGPMTDQTFAQKAMETNLAEIMLAKLALQKGASERVKEFAQMMIDEHSSANEQLKAIVSGVAMGNAPEKTGTMGSDAQSGAAGSMGNTGSTTGNATTGSSGAATTGEGATDTDADNVPGTAPTRSGTTGINNPSSTTSGVTDNNNVDNRTEKTGSDSGLGTTASPVAGSRMGRTDNQGDHAPGMSSAYFEDSTMLSPEHRAAKEKLQNLTGAAFDREYIQGQIKDHDRTALLFEYEIKNGQDARLKEYARTLLPAIRKHRQMATEIANSMMSRGANN